MNEQTLKQSADSGRLLCAGKTELKKQTLSCVLTNKHSYAYFNFITPESRRQVTLHDIW